jgi:hypothetical protein
LRECSSCLVGISNVHLLCDLACEISRAVPTVFSVQLRAHFEDALKAGKPLVVGEFGKQHYSGMAVRRDFMARVYGEVEAWNAKHGNVAGARVM